MDLPRLVAVEDGKDLSRVCVKRLGNHPGHACEPDAIDRKNLVIGVHAGPP